MNCAAPARPVALLTGRAEEMCLTAPPASNRRYWVSCWSEVGIGGSEIAKKGQDFY